MRLLRDSLIIFRRSMRYTYRKPAWIAVGLIQPFLYLVLFGPLLIKLTRTPDFGGHNAWQVFVPGLLVQQAIFSCAFVGFGIIAEARSGVLDRMKVTPACQLGLLIGRIARDVVVLITQAALLTVGALVAGLRASLGGVLIAFVLVGVLAIGMSALSYGLALRVKVEEAFGGMLNGLMLPLLLLSGVLLPMTLAPTWLADVSKGNPLSHIVTAERALFTGDIATSTTLIGVLVAVAVAVLASVFGVRALRDTRG